MSYWPLCKTYLLFPQNPSRRFLREGATAAGRPCISGTYLPHALLHVGDTPSARTRIYGSLTEALKQYQLACYAQQMRVSVRSCSSTGTRSTRCVSNAAPRTMQPESSCGRYES